MPRDPDAVDLLVLNYNGRALLAECLPSLLAAAAAAPMPCRVCLVDNGSTDDSLEWLQATYPQVEVSRRPNEGLASFNSVVADLRADVVLLLNNDVKLDRGAIGPLVNEVRARPDALFAAPQCWTFDGLTYEGMRTRVRSRFGMAQGLCRVEGHERMVEEPGTTASAGPILAVDREKFLALGGYDPIYFPGRIEDLDLGFRGYLAGWRGYYVPEARASHKGAGSFGPAFGDEGCDELAIRNTLLFTWKNLKGGRLAGHFGWLVVRVMLALMTWQVRTLRAYRDALRLAPSLRRSTGLRRAEHLERQERFFEEFAFPRELAGSGGWSRTGDVKGLPLEA